MRTYGLGAVLAAAAVLAGLHVRAAAADRAALDDAAAEAAELDAVDQVHRDCRRQQEHLVVDLLLGRVSLPAAADELLRINAARGDWAATIAVAFPDDPDSRTRAARVLIRGAEVAAADDPSRLAEPAARVVVEFESMTARPH
jgi:hypothetical protein